MKLNTLHTKISLIFVVMVILLTALFATYYYISESKDMISRHQRYVQSSFLFHRYIRFNLEIDDQQIITHFKNNGLEIIEDENLERNLYIALKEMPPQLDRRFKVVHFEDSFYVYIEDIGFGFWLKDIVSTPIHWYLIGWYGVALGFLIALYLWLFKSLKPLKTLQKEILKVSNGDLSVSLKRKGDDEIAQVANEFDNALRQIELLIQSRQLFLRTIMHELKTPIAKGRLISAMLDDEQKKEQYGSIFERLELLIEEFAKIEQMLSSNYHLKLHTYNIQDILDLAIEQLFLDEDEEIERIEIKQIAPFKINTDFNLLALALKNLLDNALKYSYDKKVLVLIEKDSISFSNNGDELKADIVEYFKPFHRYISSSSGGMGLGLYIIKNSLEKLSLKLEYRYENSKHNFQIHS